MRKRLLQESSLTLNKCVDICRAVELTDAKTKAMSGKVHAGHRLRPQTKNSRSKRKLTLLENTHLRKDNWHMNASSADTSMRDCVRNAQHGVKSVSCANQRIILPASTENHTEGEHNIMFNYKMTLIQKTRS